MSLGLKPGPKKRKEGTGDAVFDQEQQFILRMPAVSFTNVAKSPHFNCVGTELFNLPGWGLKATAVPRLPYRADMVSQ